MTPFDFVKSITHTDEYLIGTEHDAGEYVPWVVNRALSVYPDTLIDANEMNCMPWIDRRMQYDFLFHSVRKYKRPFVKYPSNKKVSENMDLVRQLYSFGNKKAHDAISVLSPEQLAELKLIFEKGG